MTTVDERQDLTQAATESGWLHRGLDRVDVFARGTDRIRVIWRGDSVISGSSLFHDDILTTYTRNLADVKGWLKR